MRLRGAGTSYKPASLFLLLSSLFGCDPGSAKDTGVGGGGSDDDGCAAHSEAECEQHDCALYRAYPINEPEHCVERDFVAKGCHELGCGARQTLGTDPEGSTWFFKDTCLPEGWTDSGVPEISFCEMETGSGGAGGAN